MSVSLEMQEHLEQQWATMLNGGNDLRGDFLKGYSSLDVSGILLHCEVEQDDVANDDGHDDDEGEPKFGNEEQIANLAVIISMDVGVDMKTHEISARPGSPGERLLETLKGAEELAEILRLLKECLLSLQHFLYLEANRKMKVVCGLIFVPGTN